MDPSIPKLPDPPAPMQAANPLLSLLTKKPSGMLSPVQAPVGLEQPQLPPPPTDTPQTQVPGALPSLAPNLPAKRPHEGEEDDDLEGDLEDEGDIGKDGEGGPGKANYAKAGRSRNKRRKIDEIEEHELWHCPFNCGKVYKRTSTVSIHQHKQNCGHRGELPIGDTEFPNGDPAVHASPNEKSPLPPRTGLRRRSQANQYSDGEDEPMGSGSKPKTPTQMGALPMPPLPGTANGGATGTNVRIGGGAFPFLVLPSNLKTTPVSLPVPNMRPPLGSPASAGAIGHLQPMQLSSDGLPPPPQMSPTIKMEPGTQGQGSDQQQQLQMQQQQQQQQQQGGMQPMQMPNSGSDNNGNNLGGLTLPPAPGSMDMSAASAASSQPMQISGNNDGSQQQSNPQQGMGMPQMGSNPSTSAPIGMPGSGPNSVPGLPNFLGTSAATTTTTTTTNPGDSSSHVNQVATQVVQQLLRAHLSQQIAQRLQAQQQLLQQQHAQLQAPQQQHAGGDEAEKGAGRSPANRAGKQGPKQPRKQGPKREPRRDFAGSGREQREPSLAAMFSSSLNSNNQSSGGGKVIQVIAAQAASEVRRPPRSDEFLMLTGDRVRRKRRRVEDLAESERWVCPAGCGKIYRKNSTISIRRHQAECVCSPEDLPASQTQTTTSQVKETSPVRIKQEGNKDNNGNGNNNNGGGMPGNGGNNSGKPNPFKPGASPTAVLGDLQKSAVAAANQNKPGGWSLPRSVQQAQLKGVTTANLFNSLVAANAMSQTPTSPAATGAPLLLGHLRAQGAAGRGNPLAGLLANRFFPGAPGSLNPPAGSPTSAGAGATGGTTPLLGAALPPSATTSGDSFLRPPMMPGLPSPSSQPLANPLSPQLQMPKPLQSLSDDGQLPGSMPTDQPLGGDSSNSAVNQGPTDMAQ